ncbi:MAG: hypothetical protein HY426_04910 [Candidatus Levybacteria bacterium]|nr:hypothetical protein [Candidatus Levybacteria bacterium]
MPDNLERHVNLGRAARGVYGLGLPLSHVCPEIRELQLRGKDLEKVQRGVNIAQAVSCMADRMDLMRTQFPPFGLVVLRDSSKWVHHEEFDLDRNFEPASLDSALQTKSPFLKVPNNYREILGSAASALSATMLYALISEAKDGNQAIRSLPHINEPKYGDPVLDIDRGVGTATQVMINILHTILLEYQLQTGHLPTFGEFREIAMGSTDIILRLSALNADFAQRLPVFFEDFTDESALRMFRLDLKDKKLTLAQPYFNDKTAPASIPYPMDVTTGCPARVQMQPGKSPPIQRIYHQLIDIVA